MRKRTRGMGGPYQRGRIWWIQFYHRGHPYRESSYSESEAEAVKLLKRRHGEIASHRFVPQEEKVTFEDLADGLVTDYKLNARKSLDTAALNNISHLRAYFGFDRAVDIIDSPIRIGKYQASRLKEGASVASVNREVGTLRRMFNLAIENRILSRKPVFKMLKGEKVREGYVEHGDFLRLLGYLPAHLQPFVEFLYYSGWRKGAARKLEWAQVDLEGQIVHLKIEDSKNDEPWKLSLCGRLWEIIQERHRERRLDIKFVFHHKGRGVGDIRKAWSTACKRAGLSGLIIHDLRRCAARNLSRAGIPEQVAMKITGHKTNSMYRRYRIVDESELREAQQKMQSYLKTQAETSKVAAMGDRG